MGNNSLEKVIPCAVIEQILQLNWHIKNTDSIPKSFNQEQREYWLIFKTAIKQRTGILFKNVP